MSLHHDRRLEPTEEEPELDPLDPEAGMTTIDTRNTGDDYEGRMDVYAGDGGDLLAEPPTGDTDDPLVAVEEGVPYVPPSDRVLSDVRLREGGPDLAGTSSSDAAELEREEMIQPPQEDGGFPRDGELLGDVLEALRSSEIVAGERLGIAVDGDTVIVRGEVESGDILDEILGSLGDVPGGGEGVDEVQVAGL